jgi:hypothetical protein
LSGLQVLTGEGPDLEETGPGAGSHPAGRQRFARCSGVQQRAYPGKRLWEGGLGEETGLATEGRSMLGCVPMGERGVAGALCGRVCGVDCGDVSEDALIREARFARDDEATAELDERSTTKVASVLVFLSSRHNNSYDIVRFLLFIFTAIVLTE